MPRPPAYARLAGATRAGLASACLEWLQSIAGAALLCFLWLHLLLLASVLAGPALLDDLGRFLADWRLDRLAGGLAVLLLLLHALAAARRLPLRLTELGPFWEQARLLRHGDTWLWLLQVGSGLGVLLLGAIHLWEALGSLPVAAATSAARTRQWPWAVFYLLLLPLVELHAAAGLYRLAVKWGLLSQRRRLRGRSLARWLALAGLGLGLLVLARLMTLDLA